MTQHPIWSTDTNLCLQGTNLLPVSGHTERVGAQAGETALIPRAIYLSAFKAAAVAAVWSEAFWADQMFLQMEVPVRQQQRWQAGQQDVQPSPVLVGPPAEAVAAVLYVAQCMLDSPEPLSISKELPPF